MPSLLGHKVGPKGSMYELERTHAIVGLDLLKDVTQVHQFVGCTNWVRRYLFPCYASAFKAPGEYMKPKAEFRLVVLIAETLVCQVPEVVVQAGQLSFQFRIQEPEY